MLPTYSQAGIQQGIALKKYAIVNSGVAGDIFANAGIGSPAFPVEVWWRNTSGGTGSSQSIPAIYIRNFAAGSYVRFINETGTIQGTGGADGNGGAGGLGRNTIAYATYGGTATGSVGAAGGSGYEALNVAAMTNVAVLFDNRATLTRGVGGSGGGGGGGGGAASCSRLGGENGYTVGGGGGGGGNGATNGAPGTGGTATGAFGSGSNYTAPDGSGTSGGPYTHYGEYLQLYSGAGGDGGAVGAAGASGGLGYSGWNERDTVTGSGGAAGSAGAVGNCVVGDSRITWVATGTRTGAIT